MVEGERLYRHLRKYGPLTYVYEYICLHVLREVSMLMGERENAGEEVDAEIFS